MSTSWPRRRCPKHSDGAADDECDPSVSSGQSAPGPTRRGFHQPPRLGMPNPAAAGLRIKGAQVQLALILSFAVSKEKPTACNATSSVNLRSYLTSLDNKLVSPAGSFGDKWGFEKTAAGNRTAWLQFSRIPVFSHNRARSRETQHFSATKRCAVSMCPTTCRTNTNPSSNGS